MFATLCRLKLIFQMDPESHYMFMFLCVGVNTGSTFYPNCGLLLIILTNWIKTWLIKIKNFWCNLDWTLYWLTLFHKQFIKRRYFSQHMVSEKTQLQKYFCIKYMNFNFRLAHHCKTKSCGRKKSVNME